MLTFSTLANYYYYYIHKNIICRSIRYIACGERRALHRIFYCTVLTCGWLSVSSLCRPGRLALLDSPRSKLVLVISIWLSEYLRSDYKTYFNDLNIVVEMHNIRTGLVKIGLNSKAETKNQRLLNM